MYCPICKAEYEEGYKECSKCCVDLVPGFISKRDKINKDGISIVKYGVALLFASLLQAIAVIIIYDFYWICRLKMLGEIQGSAIQNIHPVIWCLITGELITSVIVMIWGTKFRI